MTCQLVALCFDANEPLRLARFWAEALRWRVDDGTLEEIGLVPTDDTRFRVVFLASPVQKMGKNRIHIDLTSTSLDDQHATGTKKRRSGRRTAPGRSSPGARHLAQRWARTDFIFM
jgi:hypothetical protein